MGHPDGPQSAPQLSGTFHQREPMLLPLPGVSLCAQDLGYHPAQETPRFSSPERLTRRSPRGLYLRP